MGGNGCSKGHTRGPARSGRNGASGATLCGGGHPASVKRGSVEGDATGGTTKQRCAWAGVSRHEEKSIPYVQLKGAYPPVERQQQQG